MTELKVIVVTGILLTAVHVTGKTTNSVEYEKTFVKGFLGAIPPFIPQGKNVRPQCLADSQEYARDLQKMKYWAYQMHDASAKPNSGMLNGNLHAFGDYEQCLNVSHPRIKGQYCVLAFDIDFHDGSSYRGTLRDLFNSAYTDRLWYGNDHNLPKGEEPVLKKLLWGFCIPSSCNVEDLQNSLRHVLAPFNSTEKGLEIRMKVLEGSCTTEESKPLSGNAYLVISLLVAIFALTMFATLYDHYQQSPDGALVDVGSLSLPLKIALAFSLKRTVPNLLDCRTRNDGSDVSCVNGIRFIYALQIFVGHKMLFTFFYPVTNRTSTIRQVLDSEFSMFFGATLNSIDTFVLMSGLLVGFNGFQQLRAGRTFNIPVMYLKRYFKFMPLYLMAVLLIRDVFPYILRNPHNISVMDERFGHCQNIWKPLTYTSNLDSLDKMCHPVSHQVITDMQMYLLSPFVVLFLWKYKSTAFKIVTVALGVICFYSGWVIYSKKLTAVGYHGIAFSLAIDSVDVMYLNPIHRLPPYLVGILLGYVLISHKSNPIRLNSIQLLVGHILAAILAYQSYFYLAHCAKPTYQYNPLEHAVYKAIHPFMWGYVLSWIIFICYTGHAKTLNRMLSFSTYLLFSKISYAFYMYQTVVIVMNLHVQRLPTYLHIVSLLDPGPLIRILLESAALTLVFCLPVNLIEKHLKTPAVSDKSKKT